nr:MAG TPA: hypothetical protein [Caudoviricetes sp.]
MSRIRNRRSFLNQKPSIPPTAVHEAAVKAGL